MATTTQASQTQAKPRFNTHKLTISERPTTRYEYYVSGRGPFPFDMLRYDNCWPASSEDAMKLDVDMLADKTYRSIRMYSYQEPTVGRWGSFLWSVGNEKL